MAGVAAEGLAPCSLNKWVVGRKNNDLINALGLEFGNLLDVGRDMVGGTSGSESSGDGDNYYLFIRKLLVGIIDNGNAASYIRFMSQFVCLMNKWNQKLTSDTFGFRLVGNVGELNT